MAFTGIGYINKRKRLEAADAKITQPEGRYLKTMFFSKDERVGVLAVWEGRMEWTVYADRMMTSHVDWNDPDCTCLNFLGSQTTIIHVMSTLIEQGFSFTNERFEMKGPIKCINCDNEITIDIAKAIDEEGEVYRCPHCGFVFRYTDK